jgi:CIC family chloride channel protein
MSRSSIKTLLIIPITIGILSGLASAAFVEAIKYCTDLFLVYFVGYVQPHPAGEGIVDDTYVFFMKHYYLLPVSTCIGGLLSGLLVYKFAPEAAGVGTDAAIKAYHNENADLSLKTSFVKFIASALTIGSGSTSGKEGPIALIGAGIGSFIAKLFGLNKKGRSIAFAIGLGSGVSAIFRAPLAGAIIASEIFYTEDFEMEPLVPGIIASIVSFGVYGYFFNFGTVFGVTIPIFNGLSIMDFGIYVLFGVVCALISMFLVYTFFEISDIFKKIEIKPYYKTALGGLLVGLIGLINPIVIGNGYGWIQLILDGKLDIVNIYMIISAIPLIVLAMSLTIGSGGSGGVFGPSLITGGLTGAVFYTGLVWFFPSTHISLQALVIIGMILVFGGATKAPLSTIVLVSEMTHGYELLVPTLISIVVVMVAGHERGIFPSQIDKRRHRLREI